MVGDNQEDWWIGDATMEIKPTGFTRRGGGMNYGNAWNTGYEYARITYNVATLTRVELVDLLGLPLAANSKQITYQDDVVPATPFVITLDEDLADDGEITVFAHVGDGQFSLMTPSTGAPADDTEYQIAVGPPSTITFHTDAEGEQVRIRHTLDSTNGESAILAGDYFPSEVPGVFFTSEWIEGDPADTIHGILWDIPSMILHPDSILRFGGNAQGAEGEASTLIYQIQGTALPTVNRW
ncbi:MAG: hypothetical protein WC495_02925 [Patescibacteria group bacterium]|jgi:hypothetical protein